MSEPATLDELRCDIDALRLLVDTLVGLLIAKSAFTHEELQRRIEANIPTQLDTRAVAHANRLLRRGR